MNDKSGSTLQKASFALLILIAAALAYLIVRDRVRSDREDRSLNQVPPPSAASSASASATAPSKWGEMKSSFTPLRSRAGAGTERVTTNQRVIARNSVQSGISSSPDVVSHLSLGGGSPPGIAVPATTLLGAGA